MLETLAGGRLRVCGGLISLDARVSWTPPGLGGLQPSNCYVLTEPGAALLVDSGLAIHETEVLDGIAECVGDGAALSVFFTRGEMDCVSNLEAISRRFDIGCLFTGGVVNPFDAFDDINRMRHRGRRAQIDIRNEAGDAMPRTPRIAIGTERALEIESPLLRLLPTFWGWDAQTGAIFTSDVFTHATLTDPTQSRVIDPSTDDPTTMESVSGHLLAKYEWLRRATTEPLREWLAARFAALKPEIIAPSRGCVLRGRSVVDRHLGLMLEALEAARA